MRRTGLALGLLVLSAAGVAQGAGRSESDDFDWTGFYLGAHAGYGFGNGPATVSDSAAANTKGSLSTLLGGVQVGYRHRFPSRLLLGLESDLTFPNFFPGDDAAAAFQSPTESYALSVDMIGTVRGNVGYAFDRLLIYASGGLAWTLQHFSETPGVASTEDDSWHTLPGWTAGAGAELALTRDWSVRVEVSHDQLARTTAVLPSGTSCSSSQGVTTFLAGLNWRFDWPGARAPEAQSMASAERQPEARASIRPEAWNVHGQSTFIEQGYPPFPSPYQGPMSMPGSGEARETFSASLFLGARLWKGAELDLNPEVTQGFGLNMTRGVDAFPNGEAQKAGFYVPRFNFPRILLTQTFGFGGEREAVEDEALQLAGERDVSRLSITIGKMPTTDYFTVNAYAGSSRTSFMNFNIYGQGSYDWTMDLLSYTWGGLIEFNQKHWAARVGYFLVPLTSNVDTFDLDIPNHGEYAAELELRYAPLTHPGRLRLFGWANRAIMGSYAAALAEPASTPTYPDITLVRELRTNYGVELGLEQAITDDIGLFSRASWSPGQDEIIGWVEAAEALALGGTMKGNRWRRPTDTVGLGGVIEGLSKEAIAYFAAGGTAIMLGDGSLSYGPEVAGEAFYSYSPFKWFAVTLDYQLMGNPGFNAERGPISFFALRLHGEL